jgi:hypothetical protein
MKYSRDIGLITGIELVKLIDYTDVEEELSLPSGFCLCQNYPNPFNPATSISYSIPKNSIVVIKMSGVNGREVITLVSEEKSAGSYEVNFNGSELSSSVYFYKLEAKNFVSVKKMILLN